MTRYTFSPTPRRVSPLSASVVLTTYEKRLIAQHYAKVARQSQGLVRPYGPSPDTGARKSGITFANVLIATVIVYVLLVGAMVIL